MKWLRITLVSVLIGILLPIISPPVPAMAATTADVLVTATPGWGAAFTLTHVTDKRIEIDWTIPTQYDQVIIRAKYGEYPVEPSPGNEPTDGYLVYSGNGTWAVDTSMNLDYSGDQLYYRAWAGNSTTLLWSAYFGQDYVEGIGMTLIAEQLEGLTNFIFSFNLFIVFIPLILFSIIAFWKENSIVFMLTAGISLASGFYCYNVDTSPFMFGVSLVLWVYSIICLAFGLMCMFKRSPTD